MRPGVCTAPEPAPERDRPSEGCQLAVRKKDNYVARRRQAQTWHTGAEAYPCYVVVLGLRATSSCYAFVLRLYLTPFGSSPHHHICGSGFCLGQISLSVSPSYSRPF